MKPVPCMVFLATACIALAQTQTTKSPPSAKKPTVSAHKNPAEQLPFGDARDMTVIIVRVPVSQPSSPGTPPILQGFPVAVGSGVWIGKDGYVATCQHVIADSQGFVFKIGIARDPYMTEGGFNISVSGVVNLVEAEIVSSDLDTDVAILKSKTPPNKVPLGPLVSGFGPSITPQRPITPKGATLKTEFPKSGETLLLAGFPIAETAQKTLVLQTGVATGFISSPRRESSRPPSNLRLMLSMVSNPGNSGGPVLDADGKVVGLLEGNLPSPIRDKEGRDLTYLRPKLDATGQPIRDASGQLVSEVAPYLQNSGISVAVPAKFIAELAKKNNIDLN